MADYNYEIAQILHWANENEAFRRQLLTDPESTFNALAAAGFPISDRARQILGRVSAANFRDQYQKAASRFSADRLQKPLPSLEEPVSDDVKLETISNADFANWLQSNASLRETFLNDAQNAFKAIEAAGYTLSADSQRQLKILNRDNFTQKAQEFTRAVAKGPLPNNLETPSERIVNTGFAPQSTAEQPADSTKPLQTAVPYYFWLEVGAHIPGTIEEEDILLPIDKLPPNVQLQVVLFSFANELETTPGQEIGLIQVPPTGDVQVVQRVATPPVGEAMLSRRLFFPVRTPAVPGVYRLRCHIYYRQNLVQSRLVTAHVGTAPSVGQPALVSEVDYTLSKTLDGRYLTAMQPNRLSLMLNDNGNSTHGFRYFGENEFKQDVTLGEGELNTLIKMARAVLRRASWGDEDDYAEGKTYRYDGVRDMKQLQRDLTLFAQRGYRFFADLILPLAEGQDPWEVMDWLLPPGQIQFASKRSARLVLPLAMMYDYPFDDGLALDDYSLCPTFTGALQNGAPLAETACFQGQCPSHGNDRVICPSGFWGFRHSIGLPVTTDAAPDAPAEIPVADKPGMATSVYTDFKLLGEHTKRLQALPIQWELAESRNDALNLLKRTEAQAVYFYCHGGLVKDLPFLQVGSQGDDRLVANNILNKRIRWRKVRPLIFINGCHTTALSPEAALDFVSTFVGVAHAAGVIGTEITIFEPLAVTFAETFFKLFLEDKMRVGEAIRQTRLKLLQEWNPLGLVYIPYVLPSLKLA